MVDLEVVAVLRQCRRCGEWKSLKVFDAHRRWVDRVCRRCMYVKTNETALPGSVGSIARPRTIVITPLGRADLKHWRAEEAAAVA